MTKEEAIDYLQDAKSALSYKLDEAINMAIEALLTETISFDFSKLSSGQLYDIRRHRANALAAKWIPCSERLPEEGERVLATHLGGVNPNRQVIEHIYQCGEFTCGWDMDMNVGSSTFGQRYMGKVIAWMPLPKPYRGEQIDSNT